MYNPQDSAGCTVNICYSVIREINERIISDIFYTATFFPLLVCPRFYAKRLGCMCFKICDVILFFLKMK